jgi:hypothetical protein
LKAQQHTLPRDDGQRSWFFSLGGKIGDDVGRPGEATVLQPGGYKSLAAVLADNLSNR